MKMRKIEEMMIHARLKKPVKRARQIMKSEALQDLEKLSYEEKRRLYPGVPSCALIKTKYTDTTTNDLQTALVDYIDVIGGWATRINTQGQWIEKLGRHIPGQTKRGTTDIIGVLPGGKFIAIECKQPGEKLRDEQFEVKDDIIKANGLHLVARVGDFQAVYDRINEAIKQTTICQE